MGVVLSGGNTPHDQPDAATTTIRAEKTMNLIDTSVVLICISLVCCHPERTVAEDVLETDVCVYGGTASGVTAGLAAARRGRSVIIVEPFQHLGGMHGGGIRIQQDSPVPFPEKGALPARYRPDKPARANEAQENGEPLLR